MEKLNQEATGVGQLFPSPENGEILYETPPVLIWRRDNSVSDLYHVTVKDSSDCIVYECDTERLFVTPNKLLEPGQYFWNITSENKERGWQSFSIAENAVRLPRITARQLFDAVPEVHPRHLFYESDIASLLDTRREAVEILKKNVEMAFKDGLPQPPRFHMDENALPYREYFGRHRDFCDRNLIACGLAYRLLHDEKAGHHGKELLLTICSWNPDMPCSIEGIWGDELGLSHARCLPAAYDLLYDLLDERQRKGVERTILAYARQIEHLLSRTNFCDNPGSSHSGRLPAYLGEAALVLKGSTEAEEETLMRYLTLALDVYGGFFPYYGGADGSWAEGTFYASSYTRWYLPFFSAVERYTGFSFLQRPFYQRLVNFFQHFCPPGWEIHPFCDGYWCKSEDAEWPGFFAQNPFRVYADRFGDEVTKAWRKQLDNTDYYRLHLLDIFLPEGKAPASPLSAPTDRAHCFPKGGFVSLHTDPEHPEKEVSLLARCSRFGSVSHQHADQGSFALMAGGNALISPSGYFGRKYGTKHHYEYTNTSIAHNTLLVDGVGQETFSYKATGQVLSAQDHGDTLTASIDPSGAYPLLNKWERSFVLSEDKLIVTDHVEAKQPVTLTYLLHALSRPIATDFGAELSRGGYRLRIDPIKGLKTGVEISDQFPVDLNAGEPEQFHVTMPPQYHMKFFTEKKQLHDIVVEYSITKE